MSKINKLPYHERLRRARMALAAEDFERFEALLWGAEKSALDDNMFEELENLTRKGCNRYHKGYRIRQVVDGNICIAGGAHV